MALPDTRIGFVAVLPTFARTPSGEYFDIRICNDARWPGLRVEDRDGYD
jgi:hypothetical protein